MKLAILTNILTPYRLPLFEALAARTDDLMVLLMAEHEENRHWNLAPVRFRTTVLRGVHVKPPGYDVSLHLNYGVASALRKVAPDAVLSGGFAPANLAALRYCRRSGSAFVGWGELTLRDPAAGSPIRRRIRRWIGGRSDGAVASSSEARDAFVHDGVPRARVLTAPMPVDVEFFRTRTAEVRQSVEHRRRNLAYSSPVFLTIGQLIARKGYRELFAIYERLLLRWPSATLIIVGEGPERQNYQHLVRERGWMNVHFVGFVQATDLPKWFALADIFIFPTLFDPFGAVLAEAMAAGVPVAASIHAAATADLVADGETGVLIEPYDPASSATAIAEMLDLSPERRTAMGEAAARFLGRFTYDATAGEIVRFVQELLLPEHGTAGSRLINTRSEQTVTVNHA